MALAPTLLGKVWLAARSTLAASGNRASSGNFSHILGGRRLDLLAQHRCNWCCSGGGDHDG
jgi:hypothetical protein